MSHRWSHDEYYVQNYTEIACNDCMTNYLDITLSISRYIASRNTTAMRAKYNMYLQFCPLVRLMPCTFLKLWLSIIAAFSNKPPYIGQEKWRKRRGMIKVISPIKAYYTGVYRSRIFSDPSLSTRYCNVMSRVDIYSWLCMYKHQEEGRREVCVQVWIQ